jgi:L-fuconolactonase
MRIDAHQHFWMYNEIDYDWIGSGMEVLKRDRLPADLAPLLQAAQLDGAVAVQARSSLEETAWLLQLADESSIIKGVVGWIDLCSPDARAQLQRFSQHPRLCGVRHIVQSEPDDRFMLRDDFLRGVALLGDFNLAYDILIFPRHLPIGYELAARFPAQTFVLDHSAKPLIKDHVIEPWATDLRRLASLPNVYCKVSGLLTEADWQQWSPNDFLPYLDVVFDVFSPRRIMYGSDWPVCTLAGSYADYAALIEDYTRSLSADDLAAVWGNTAERAYQLKP